LTSARIDPPSSGRGARPGTLRRWIGRLLAGIRNLFILAFVLACLLAVYLTVVGVPARLIEPRLAWLRENGLNVRIERIRLDILRGVAAEGLAFYDAPDRPVPMFEAQRVVFNFNPLEWLRGRHGLRRVWLNGAAIRVDTRGTLDSRDSAETLSLDRANLQVRIEPASVVISRFDTSVLGIKVHGEGTVLRETAARPRMTLAEMSRLLSSTLKNLPAWLPSLAEQLNAIRFDLPPRADFSFTLYPTNPLRTTVSAKIQAGHTQARGVALDAWGVEASLTNGRVRLVSLFAQAGKQRCDGSGTLELTNRVLEARASSDLPPEYWLRLVPKAWSDQLAKVGIELSGPGAFEVWLGPAPVKEIPEHISGWVSLEKADIHGIWIEKGFAAFQREKELATFTKIDTVLGKGREQGPVRGTGWYRFDTQEYGARGRSEADPHILLPITTKNQARVIRSFDFRETPPVVDLDISGVVPRPKEFKLAGHVWGTNFTRYGAEVVSLDTPIAVTNGVLFMTPLQAFRTDGRVEGWLAIDMDNGWADFNATSTVAPYALGAVIDPKAEQILRNYRLEGPARVVAKGRVDYDGWEETDFEGWVEGEKMGIHWMLADRASFHIRGVGTRLDFTDVEGEIYDGTFAGSASFENIEQPTNTQYEISGYLENLDFLQLVRSLTNGPAGDPYTGRLTASTIVRGIIGAGRGDTVVGEGRLKITEGHLFQLPIFGGLSSLLSKIYPGFGFATQTAFESSFTVANRQFHSNDAFLKGTMLSISGQGDYYMDSRVDVNVQVQLLRSGSLASVLRLITYPVTKLLEFHLGGTLKDPHWRPINLPKELFLIFD
jgi:hypothetical protein